MVITKTQYEGIQALYGDDSNGFKQTIQKISEKRGVLKIFNEDGSLNLSREELEKKLNRPARKSTTTPTNKPNVCMLLKQAIHQISKMNDLSDYEYIIVSLKEAYDVLKRKKEELREIEISRIENEIRELQEKKSRLLNNEIK